jgi:hypothetical protein
MRQYAVLRSDTGASVVVRDVSLFPFSWMYLCSAMRVDTGKSSKCTVDLVYVKA